MSILEWWIWNSLKSLMYSQKSRSQKLLLQNWSLRECSLDLSMYSKVLSLISFFLMYESSKTILSVLLSIECLMNSYSIRSYSPKIKPKLASARSWLRNLSFFLTSWYWMLCKIAPILVNGKFSNLCFSCSWMLTLSLNVRSSWFGIFPGFFFGLLNYPRTLLQVLMMKFKLVLPRSSLNINMNLLFRQSQSIN